MKITDLISSIAIPLATPVVTLVIGYLVYRYTTSNNKKQLLNSLDDKSEWRKTLYDISGSKDIDIGSIHKLRTSLRFNINLEQDQKFIYPNFRNMSYLILYYCDSVCDLNCKINTNLVRLFCRYLLADHWEKNQLSYKETKYLNNYYIHKNIIKGNKELSFLTSLIFYNYFYTLINGIITPDRKNNVKHWFVKEQELINHTLLKYCEYTHINIEDIDSYKICLNEFELPFLPNTNIEIEKNSKLFNLILKNE